MGKFFKTALTMAEKQNIAFLTGGVDAQMGVNNKEKVIKSNDALYGLSTGLMGSMAGSLPGITMFSKGKKGGKLLALGGSLGAAAGAALGIHSSRSTLSKQYEKGKNLTEAALKRGKTPIFTDMYNSSFRLRKRNPDNIINRR